MAIANRLLAIAAAAALAVPLVARADQGSRDAAIQQAVHQQIVQSAVQQSLESQLQQQQSALQTQQQSMQMQAQSAVRSQLFVLQQIQIQQQLLLIQAELGALQSAKKPAKSKHTHP